MSKFLGVLAMTVLVAFSAGCDSKKSKCQKGFKQMAETAKPFAGIANMVGKALGKDFDIDAKIREVEPKFMAACLQLPDDAMDCVSKLPGSIIDPACIAQVAKLPQLR